MGKNNIENKRQELIEEFKQLEQERAELKEKLKYMPKFMHPFLKIRLKAVTRNISTVEKELRKQNVEQQVKRGIAIGSVQNSVVKIQQSFPGAKPNKGTTVIDKIENSTIEIED